MKTKLAAVWIATALAAAGQESAGQTGRDIRFHKDIETTPAFTIPRSYALVIGIARYRNLPESGQLKFAERDAADIYTALISAEGGNFPPENVVRLIGPAATLTNIKRQLEGWLPSTSQDGDRVLIYFAGHGFVADGQAYLAPYDVDRDDVTHTAYPMDRLGEVFGSRIRAKWRVLLTDACHSGAILPGTQALNSSDLNVSPSVFSLTASRDREQSFEGTPWGGGHGVFTYYLMKGLQGEADYSGDGKVTADELTEYVRANVRTDTQARQTPTSDRGSFDRDMVLAYNPTRVKAAPRAAPQFGRFVVESNMDGVEILVDGKSAGVLTKEKPLLLPGMTAGQHTILGVHTGYEPDGPREEIIYPGQDTTVTLRIIVVRRRKQAAVDAFDKGFAAYQAGGAKNYRQAVDRFSDALRIEPAYSQAALYLAASYNALFEQDQANIFFRRALEIDPDYTEARTRYGGALLDRGDFDGAIRQLTAVARREPQRAIAHYMLAVAFTRKAAYEEAVREGREAVRLSPANGEAHFWLAEALRMSGQCGEAAPEYTQYLRLSDFDSKLGGKLNYYVLGYLFGSGQKKRAALHDIWMDLRNQAYFGVCDCERIGKQFDAAIRSCQAALSYDGGDPFAHYTLGILFSEKFNRQGNAGLLAAAKTHFQAVIAYNAQTQEAGKSQRYIDDIDRVLQRLQ
jgi:tetratricopeptide (TPR) repeat protein